MAEPYLRSQGRRAKLTREGRAFVFVTVGVAFAALNTGNNLIYLMLGLLLSLILLSMVMSELVMERLRVERLPPLRAFAGSPAQVRYAVANGRQWTASYALTVSDDREGDGPGPAAGAFFLRVAPGERAEATVEVTPAHRGVHALRGYRIRTRYPFGVVEKSKRYTQPVEWLVFPALEPVAHAWPAFRRTGEERALERPGPGAELGSLREYRAGDEARTIHWRRSAALGALVVRERQREAASLVQVVVDNLAPRDADAVWADGFERTISRAAYLVTEAVRRGAATEIIARGSASVRVDHPARLDQLYRFLALLEPVPADAAAEPLPLKAASRGAHVVVASVPPPAPKAA